MFPDEVWEEIFIHVDDEELEKLKTVSKAWNRILTRFITVKYGYYEKCCKEIPVTYWSSILAPMAHPEIQNNDFDAAKKHSHIWRSMYRSWIGWNSLIDKSPSCQTVEVPGRIFDHEVAGKIVAISGDDDYVRLHDLSEKNQIEPRKLDKYPRKMDFSRIYDRILLIGRYYCEKCEIIVRKWNMNSTEAILMAAEFTKGFITSSSLDHSEKFDAASTAKNLNSFKHHPYDECKRIKIKIYESDGEIHEFLVPKTFMHVTFQDRYSKQWPLLSTIIGVSFGVYSPQWSIRRSSAPTNLFFGSCGLDFYYSWKFTSSSLAFSVDGGEWKFYDAKRDLNITSGITALRYHVGVLMIGLKSGELQIVHVKDCLEELDFKTMPSSVVKLDCNPILNIKVTEYNSIQYIIARTDLQLHIVKFG